MKAKITDIVPGRILYHVYGVDRTRTIINERDVNRVIITSKPFVEKYTGSLFVKAIECYVDHNGNERSYHSERSLSDMGIMQDGKSPYNLNRAFTSKISAMQFQEELSLDTFSDPVDQAYASLYDAAEELYERDNRDDIWENW